MLKRYALRIEHAKDVMIGDKQQVCGGAEPIIRVGEHARINVTVRTDERRVGNLMIEMSGDFFLPRIRVKIAIC